MARADVGGVGRLTDEDLHDFDVRADRAGWAEPTCRSAAGSAWSRTGLEHLVRHDPAGCWVAEDAHGLLGTAASMRRDLTWLLATYAVRPGVQGRGVGRQLLDAALSHGSGVLRGMIAASEDPLAVRRYRLAGFGLHPT